MNRGLSIQRTLSVARKEFLHILRDPTTFVFACFFPVLQLFMLGYAIETNVRHVRTVVLDLARTKESERLIRRFENSTTFRIVHVPVHSDEELRQAIVAGKARVGIKIPADYSQKTTYGMKPSQVLLLVDGSESNVAGTASNVGSALLMEEAMLIMQGDGQTEPPVKAETRVLFNPNTRTTNFFLPGLLVVLTQMMATTLSANAIVREKENGTMEQLFMTPVRPIELIIGKMLPYLALALAEFAGIVFLIWSVFQVPIHGPLLALLALSLPFVICFLGLGLMISTRVNTREAANHAAIATLLPSIFLSGYVFPNDSMPALFYCISQALPTTWMIDASRGVILRYAGWNELWPHAIVLWGMALATLTLSMVMFRKRL